MQRLAGIGFALVAVPAPVPLLGPAEGVVLADDIFEYLEIWHDRRRRHSSLGMLTPIEFENTTIVA